MLHNILDVLAKLKKVVSPGGRTKLKIKLRTYIINVYTVICTYIINVHTHFRFSPGTFSWPAIGQRVWWASEPDLRSHLSANYLIRLQNQTELSAFCPLVWSTYETICPTSLAVLKNTKYLFRKHVKIPH